MTISKHDLVSAVSDRLNLSLRDGRKLVNLFFDVVVDELAEGNEIAFRSFGKFYFINKNARPGRNPKTGKEYLIAARKVCAFKAGEKLKEAAKENARKNSIVTM